MVLTITELFGGKTTSGAPVAPHLDKRDCAIFVCAIWSEVNATLLKHVDSRGLVRRSDVVRGARSIENRLETVPRPASRGMEHPDTRAACLAAVDWISHAAGRLSKRSSTVRLRDMDRFFWGYIENTALFDHFFTSRKANLDQRPASPKGFLPSGQKMTPEGICHMGFAYGTPTLGALFDKTRSGRGRGILPRIGLNDSIWDVLAMNKDARKFVSLANLVPSANDLGPDVYLLSEDLAGQTKALVTDVIAGKEGGPQFIVDRGEGRRMRLSLKVAPERGFSAQSHNTNPDAWRRCRYGLFQSIEDCMQRNFEPLREATPGDEAWGKYERLHWHLSAIPSNARTHAQMFNDN